MTELRKCPFCGGEAELSLYWEDTYCVYCKRCEAKTDGFAYPKDAIEAWNKRVPPTSKDIEEYVEKTHKENMEMVAKLKRKCEVQE